MKSTRWCCFNSTILYCSFIFIRVARTMVPPSSGPVGINELEGSVLLEADDYLRVCHDVKALKTVLLRLKREIQTDVSH